ncbi:hypothetical protein HPP92_006563 [Vanilla planifolia]|uniref:Uncharacterized protein n=1 Tax=Vanilla planifolia TaxID=51239 RepID=A0A835RF60_VANPL|nr:hypothetical protein HPP92_006822 [Vanilla planifolia]KAG0489700.1 hypothetical protein HPP92_006563 [Vanilla planifolia]
MVTYKVRDKLSRPYVSWSQAEGKLGPEQRAAKSYRGAGQDRESRGARRGARSFGDLITASPRGYIKWWWHNTVRANLKLRRLAAARPLWPKGRWFAMISHEIPPCARDAATGVPEAHHLGRIAHPR